MHCQYSSISTKKLEINLNFSRSKAVVYFNWRSRSIWTIPTIHQPSCTIWAWCSCATVARSFSFFPRPTLAFRCLPRTFLQLSVWHFARLLQASLFLCFWRLQLQVSAWSLVPSILFAFFLHLRADVPLFKRRFSLSHFTSLLFLLFWTSTKSDWLSTSGQNSENVASVLDCALHNWNFRYGFS